MICMNNNDNNIMASVYGDLCRILRYIEKSIDDDSFEEKWFYKKFEGVPLNRLARLCKMLLQEEYVTGIEVRDFGECDKLTNKATYKRFSIIFNEPSITIKGLKFLAENSILARTYSLVKNTKDLL